MGDFTNPRNTDFQLKVSVTIVPDGGGPPAPVDVTGWTFWFTVKRYVQDADKDAVYQAKTGDGSGNMTITDAPNGKLHARLPAIKTVGFADGVTALVYDVQARDVSGIVTTIDAGTLGITPSVTRATV